MAIFVASRKTRRRGLRQADVSPLPPGAVTFQMPEREPRGTTLYFVVRARNAAGHEDTNTAERQGVVSCPPLNQPAGQLAGG